MHDMNALWDDGLLVLELWISTADVTGYLNPLVRPDVSPAYLTYPYAVVSGPRI